MDKDKVLVCLDKLIEMLEKYQSSSIWAASTFSSDDNTLVRLVEAAIPENYGKIKGLRLIGGWANRIAKKYDKKHSMTSAELIAAANKDEKDEFIKLVDKVDIYAFNRSGLGRYFSSDDK